MADDKLEPPLGYTELDSSSYEQFRGLLNSTLEDSTGELFNEYINKTLSENGATYTSIDSAALYLAGAFAESGQISVDSAFVLVQNAMWDSIINKPKEKDEGTTNKDISNSKAVGSLIGMENAKKHLQLKELDKASEFAKIKSLYGLDDTATKDEAYGMLLEDLSANELHSIYTSGGLMDTYKDIEGNPMTRESMMPIPLSVTKSGQSYSYYGGSPSTATFQSKMTKEDFKNYLRNDRFKHLAERQRTGGLKMDFKKTAAAADEYASTNLDDNYKSYVDYQRELLKDISSDALSGAFDILEAVKEVEAIFTD